MKKTLLVATLLLVLSTIGLSRGYVLADSKEAIVGGIEDATGQTVDENPEGEVNSLIQDIVNIFSFIVGAIAVIMLIYGGFKYITSSGDSGALSSARNTIVYALVGIVIVVLAQVVVRYVIGVGGDAINGTGTSSQQSGSGSGNTPCRQLPNGGCAPGTGP